MKTFLFIVSAFSLSLLIASSQDAKVEGAQTSQPRKISAGAAEKHYQETVVVTGKVAQVSIRPKLVYINLDKKFPESPMTCVIFARATNEFGNLKALEGRDVEIKGKIEEYRDKAQIILNSSNQLKVIEMPAEPGGSKKN